MPLANELNAALLLSGTSGRQVGDGSVWRLAAGTHGIPSRLGALECTLGPAAVQLKEQGMVYFHLLVTAYFAPQDKQTTTKKALHVFQILFASKC